MHVGVGGWCGSCSTDLVKTSNLQMWLHSQSSICVNNDTQKWRFSFCVIASHFYTVLSMQ